MAVGITQKAGEEIKQAMKSYLAAVHGEYIRIFDPVRKLDKGIKGDAVSNAVFSSGRQQYNLGQEAFNEFEKKWNNEIDRLVAAYQTQDKQSANSIYSKKS